jgi:DNA-binding response OmpR family regulator
MRVLVVEDEKSVASLISKCLSEQGFDAEIEGNGDVACQRALNESFDAIVLDIMLPGRDGLSIIRILRENRITTPVLLVTARSAISERVDGLTAGADDYLSKPFHTEELVARVKALVRRASGEGLSVLTVGDLRLNLITRDVFRGETCVDLTNREFSLLEYLMRSPRRVLTRTQIREHVWGYHFDPGTNLVDVYIQRLRKKIDGGECRKLIHTVKGVGYSIREDDDP